jgi:hypothetical protein
VPGQIFTGRLTSLRAESASQVFARSGMAPEDKGAGHTGVSPPDAGILAVRRLGLSRDPTPLASGHPYDPTWRFVVRALFPPPPRMGIESRSGRNRVRRFYLHKCDWQMSSLSSGSPRVHWGEMVEETGGVRGLLFLSFLPPRVRDHQARGPVPGGPSTRTTRVPLTGALTSAPFVNMHWLSGPPHVRLV